MAIRTLTASEWRQEIRDLQSRLDIEEEARGGEKPIQNAEDYNKFFKRDEPTIYKQNALYDGGYREPYELSFTTYYIPADYNFLYSYCSTSFMDNVNLGYIDAPFTLSRDTLYIRPPVFDNHVQFLIQSSAESFRDMLYENCPNLYQLFQERKFRYHYFGPALNDKSKISYTGLIEDRYNPDKRKMTSPQKLIPKLCREVGWTFDSKLEAEAELLNKLMTTVVDLSTIYSHEILSQPEDFHETYSMKISSCMQGLRAGYFDIYANNTDKVNIIQIKKHGVVMGRALLWTTDSGEKLLDRIYPSDTGKHITYLKQWAKENGIDSLIAQSTSAYTESGKFYDVTVDTTNCRNFPYVDSFGYLREINEENSNILVLTNDRNSTSVRSILHNTGGGIDISRERYPEYAFSECSSCGITQTRKTMFFINRRYYCEDCAKRFHPEAYAKLIAKKTGAEDVEYKA